MYINLEIEKSFDEVRELIPQINLLLITANEIETFHVRQALLPLNEDTDVIKVPHGLHTYFIGIFGEYLAVHVQLGKMGSLSYAGATLTAFESINNWNPKVVLMIGVAMGVNEEKQRIGDVLISDTIISYEIQRLSKGGITQRGSIVDAGAVLLDRFKNIAWTNPIDDGLFSKILPSQILSGEKLIDNLKERNKILKVFPQASGAEMEGAGIYAACKRANLNEWLLVKGICDYGDGNKDVDKEQRQHLAAQSATSLSLKVFSSRVGFVGIGLEPVIRVNKSSNIGSKINSDKFENEILAIVEVNQKPEIMHSAVQITVAAFLELSSYQKAKVIDTLGLPLNTLINLSAHEMDKEVFRQVKERNLLPSLWETINNIKPFENNINPFV
jgi:nucleoside phosphorylase